MIKEVVIVVVVVIFSIFSFLFLGYLHEDPTLTEVSPKVITNEESTSENSESVEVRESTEDIESLEDLTNDHLNNAFNDVDHIDFGVFHAN